MPESKSGFRYVVEEQILKGDAIWREVRKFRVEQYDGYAATPKWGTYGKWDPDWNITALNNSLTPSEGADAMANMEQHPEPPSSSNPSPPLQSWYYSPRIQAMIANKGKFSSEVESDIESSKVHWTASDPTSAGTRSRDLETVNRKYFQELILRERKPDGFRKAADPPQPERAPLFRRISPKYRGFLFNLFPYTQLFRKMDDLVVGERIGQGGQAEIYAATDRGADGMLAVKVFNAELDLRDLAQQWPQGMLAALQGGGRDLKSSGGSLHHLFGATLLKDERFLGRFAFVMDRCWGDLRKLIDHKMMQSGNRGPPFTDTEVVGIMHGIAWDMHQLHQQAPPILHQDLKSGNVLVKAQPDRWCRDDLWLPGDSETPWKKGSGYYEVMVADFECSVGVVGTGFWRAPEILVQVKNRVPSSEMVFTKEGDVYSFGMVCYELVTGRMPFEGHHPLGDVLNGQRPELPPDLNPLLRGIITSCWHPDPSQRPCFESIWKDLTKIWMFISPPTNSFLHRKINAWLNQIVRYEMINCPRRR